MAVAWAQKAASALRWFLLLLQWPSRSSLLKETTVAMEKAHDAAYPLRWFLPPLQGPSGPPLQGPSRHLLQGASRSHQNL